ncbi:MAG: hypothetical protein OJI67_08590 [Prosthecobacter sp.]|nr:hypothetical protein [Prosthecobacter sp.]
MSPERTAQLCHHWATVAQKISRKIECLEIEAEAKSRALDPQIAAEGQRAALLARDHLKDLQAALKIVTTLTDYSDHSDLADLRWHMRLACLSYDCRPAETGSAYGFAQDPLIATFLATHQEAHPIPSMALHPIRELSRKM